MWSFKHYESPLKLMTLISNDNAAQMLKIELYWKGIFAKKMTGETSSDE